MAEEGTANDRGHRDLKGHGWMTLGTTIKSLATKKGHASSVPVYRGLMWKREVYKAGDLVYLNSGDPENPFMTQIVEISVDKLDEDDSEAEEEPLLLGRWLFRSSDIDSETPNDREVHIDMKKDSYERNSFASVVPGVRPRVVTLPEYNDMAPNNNLYFFRSTINKRTFALRDVTPERASAILDEFYRLNLKSSFAWNAHCQVLHSLGDLLDVFSTEELGNFTTALEEVTRKVERQFSLLSPTEQGSVDEVKKLLTTAFLEVANTYAGPRPGPENTS